MSATTPPSTELGNPDAVPYFLWDEPMSVRELRERLATSSEPERVRLLAKDVWALERAGYRLEDALGPAASKDGGLTPAQRSSRSARMRRLPAA